MTVKLNPNYWDCECEYDYIHPKSENFCPDCGTCSDDQPDSREIEVKFLFKPKSFW